MLLDPEDLGDARSREANRGFRELAERRKSSDPAYAYAPRWVPTGNWHMSLLDLLVVAAGIAIIAMVVGMRLLGMIS
jgi:hypothetical protein